MRKSDSEGKRSRREHETAPVDGPAVDVGVTVHEQVEALPQRIVAAGRQHRDHDERLAGMGRAELLQALAEALTQASEPGLPPASSLSDDELRAFVRRLWQTRSRERRYE